MSLTKQIRLRPAFDRRHDDPRKNFGIHGVELQFYLSGEEGAVQFIVYTSWQLPHVQEEFDAQPLSRFPYMFHKPLSADIGYHSKIPRYEGQSVMPGACDFTGGACYYDGSSLYAREGFKILLEKGDEGLWQWMEEYYRETLVKP